MRGGVGWVGVGRQEEIMFKNSFNSSESDCI